MGTRRERETQFAQDPGGSSMSSQLVWGAYMLLGDALEFRHRQEGRKTDSTHYAPAAAGSIVLIVDAFGNWLDESIAQLGFFDKKILPLASEQPLQKYYKLAEAAGKSLPNNADLSMAIDLRNEIVHYLPRGLRTEGNVPPWLVELDRRSLLIPVTDSSAPWSLPDKVSSYALAYWTWEVVDTALQHFLDAIGRQKSISLGGAVENFSLYRDFCRPADLAEFDRANEPVTKAAAQ